MRFDAIDLKILSELQKEGRLSIVELAKRVHLTKTPCAERVKRLESAGVIGGYHARVNATALALSHVALVQVQLSTTTAEALEEFNRAVLAVDCIQSCHMVAGGFDYLLKVRTRDIAHYREVLGSKIAQLPHVQQTHSYVVMETVKDSADLPIPKRPFD